MPGGWALPGGCWRRAWPSPGRRGTRGVSTICQDNNLNAALFYLNSGFAIGGLDTRVYDGTKQAGKSDIFLYRAL